MLKASEHRTMSLKTSTRAAAGKASLKADSKGNLPSQEYTGLENGRHILGRAFLGHAARHSWSSHFTPTEATAQRNARLSRGGGMVAGALKGKRPRQEPAGATNAKLAEILHGRCLQK